MKPIEPFRAYREGGKIVIEVPEDNLVFAVNNSPHYSARVSNPEKYLDGVTDRVLEYCYGTDDEPMLLRLLDLVTEELLETPNSGVDLVDVD